MPLGQPPWRGGSLPGASLRSPWQCLTKAHFIPHIGTGEESFQTYHLLVQAMDEIERKTFQEWTQTLDKDCLKRLDTPLLRLSTEKPGMLDINFDK